MNDPKHHADISQRKESKQSLEEEKAILMRQIQTLEDIKSEAQRSLDISIFKTTNSSDGFCKTNNFSASQLRNLPIDGNLALKDELFCFAGIQCTKCTKSEFIFNFVAKDEGNKNCFYSVQIFNVNNRGKLGKWVLPTFIDIDLILKETPLDTIDLIAQFIVNCKYHIDCFHHRMNQLIALKESMKDVVNCFVDGNHTYQFLNIQLLGVSDAESNNKINIVVYLIYNLKETRPQKIKVDTIDDAPFSEETEKDLISYLKPFKKLTLINAVESIEKKDDSRFLWKRIDKHQSFTQEYQDSEQFCSEEWEPYRKRIRKRSLRRLPEESSTEDELTQKMKRKAKIKSKIKSNKRKSAVKTSLIRNRKDTKYQKPNAANISKFLTQDKHQPELEKESSSKESQSSGKHTAKPTEGENKITSPKKDTSPEKINSPKKSTPKKVVTPKKKEAPLRRLVTPKQIELSKKAAFSKITISPNTDEIKMKQTNLKFPILSQKTPKPSENSPAPEMTKTIKPDYKSKLWKSKVVTSTPMPLLQKNVKKPIETDLDISNITSNINEEAFKVLSNSFVVLERLEKIRSKRNPTAKSGIKIPRTVKK